MSQERVNAVTDAACARARAAELRLPEVLDDLSKSQAETHHCEGRRAQLVANPPTPAAPWQPPLSLRLGLDVAIAATTGATGATAAAGAPRELVVGLAVASVGVLVARVVLELLR